MFRYEFSGQLHRAIPILTYLTINSLLQKITELGDSGLLTLLVAITSAYLYYCRCRRAAASLLLSFVLAAGGIGTAKLLFIGCLPNLGIEIASPSGHAALSFAVYAMLAVLLASQFRKPMRLITYTFAYGLIAAMAWSRVALGYHTTNEVIAALLIGGCATIIAYMYLYHRRNAVPPFNPYFLVLILGTVAFLLHGTRLPAEGFIRQIAAQLKIYIPACNPV